jgi:hypothetical protein
MATRYSPKIATDGLVFCLDASNTKSYPGSGTTWTDISRNGNTGTLTNGPTYSSANGGSIVFDGTNDYVAYTNNNGFGTVSAAPVATLGIWAYIERKAGGGTQYQQLAGFRNDSNYDFFFLLLDSSGATVNTEARLRTATSYYDINVEYTNFNSWCYITFVANTNRSDLYINSVLAGSNTSVAGNFGSNSGNFRIGQSPNPAGDWKTKGRISQVHFYNIALTANQVLQNYNATKKRFGL